MKKKPATVHVVIRQLKEYFGDRDYKVVLSGFRSTMTFAGQITGDSIEYSPSANFDAANQLVTGSINTFPTMQNEYVTVSVFSNPDNPAKSRSSLSQLIWSTNRDNHGNRVTLNSGDDKVIIVDCSSKQLILNVMPWSEYLQHVVIP